MLQACLQGLCKLSAGSWPISPGLPSWAIDCLGLFCLCSRYVLSHDLDQSKFVSSVAHDDRLGSRAERKGNETMTPDIIFEMPSHQPNETRYIMSIAESCRSSRIGFAILLNGKNWSENSVVIRNNFVAEYRHLKITDPCISLAEARSLACALAEKHFQPKYHILSDDDFVFNNGWEDFILEAIQDMEHFSKVSNRQCYLGMGGAFGSYGHGRATFIGPQPWFPTGRGIIYTLAAAWDEMEHLPGSLDEQYLCSVLFHKGHVALRKMMSPIQHHSKHKLGYGIYSKSIVEQYNSVMVRRIWNDPKWVMKPTLTSKAVLTDGRYYAHCPKNAMKEQAKLKAELSQIPEIKQRYLTPGAQR